MKTPSRSDRARGLLPGLAAGDLNGGPVRMAVRLAESLVARRQFDPDDILARYLDWWREGAFDTGPVAAEVLALVASGKNREMASFAQYRQRVESFVTEVKPTIDAADEWHKGYELHRAMHRVFFNGEKTDLGSYSLDAALLTDIFTTGHYNCISSALLYVVLARAFVTLPLVFLGQIVVANQYFLLDVSVLASV